MSYPKWLYKGLEGVLVKDEAQEKALGPGYKDRPSEEPKAEEPKPKASRGKAK